MTESSPKPVGITPALCAGEAAALAGRMRGPSIIRTIAAGFVRLADGWFDMPAGRAIAILLVLFVGFWTLFQVVSGASTNLRPDFVEMYAWSRHPSLGYYKHPPLGAWLTALWFGFFATRDWAFWLLALVNAALALSIIDLIARRYLSGDRRRLALLLLLLTPFYQFRAVPFGANQVLLATWPAAVYCFLRAFESRRPGWAVAAGAASALAILGKYYSIFLIAGLVTAALVHPRRRDYLCSSSPWISTLAVGAVLTPHLLWLAASGYLPVHYALNVHAAASRAAALLHVGAYVAGAIAYVSVLFAAYVVAARPTWPTLREALWPSDPDRRMLAVLLWVPLIAPIPVAIGTGALLTSLWTMEAWFLLPILLLAPQAMTVRRTAAIGIAGFVAMTTLIVILASPIVAWLRSGDSSKDSRLYFRLLAAEASARWESRTGRPFSIVTGDMDLANAITFYSESHPDALPFFDLKTAPWITPARLTAEGWVALCRAADDYCVTRALGFAGNRTDVVRSDLHLVPRFIGINGPSREFLMVLAPPISAASQ